MAKLNLKPLDDRVIVEQSAAEEKTAGGIVLPDTAKEKPQQGKVLAAGPGRLLDSGERGKLSVKVGDEVFYGKYSRLGHRSERQQVRDPQGKRRAGDHRSGITRKVTKSRSRKVETEQSPKRK